MQDLNPHLSDLGDKFDQAGKTVCADAIDNLIQSDSLNKVAQYVGVIGYVLKQQRAMGNCLRKKRAAASDRAMQEIVLECLSEYQDGQDYHDTEWHSKYAQVITEHPADFDRSHLELLAQIASEQGINQHIENVENAAILLQENDEDADVVNQVLSHIQTFGGILQKEATSHYPFKLAAPSSRSRWSRFWKPNQFNWWNPMSWSGRWRGGDESDTKLEMRQILERIR